MDLNERLKRLQELHSPSGVMALNAMEPETELLLALLEGLVKQVNAHRSFIEEIADNRSPNPAIIRISNAAKKHLSHDMLTDPDEE